MTGKDFMNRVANGKGDFLQDFLDLLEAAKARFCVIGGLGVNAYADPVVSLDLDLVVAMDSVEAIVPKLKQRFKFEPFPNSLNISDRSSDLRVQIQLDPRYQDFLGKAVRKNVLGYQIPVARVEDVLQGKIWAVSDKARRPSKRQKDLADIARLLEKKPSLASQVPAEIKRQILS